jgi:hypothetical protein
MAPLSLDIRETYGRGDLFPHPSATALSPPQGTHQAELRYTVGGALPNAREALRDDRPVGAFEAEPSPCLTLAVPWHSPADAQLGTDQGEVGTWRHEPQEDHIMHPAQAIPPEAHRGCEEAGRREVQRPLRPGAGAGMAEHFGGVRHRLPSHQR